MGLRNSVNHLIYSDLYYISVYFGFTMSLFNGSLAFEHTGNNNFFDERLRIIIGSLFSAIAGYLVPRKSLRR